MTPRMRDVTIGCAALMATALIVSFTDRAALGLVLAVIAFSVFAVYGLSQRR